ncbi:iron ABC transporter permease [Vagococcus carniphilus]|uniref:Iron ABC transporter permease n=1 Tax=Vagococcus carniphilus TaxID=218144 RepID=A0AAW8U8G1_9ENTE|nr:iron ABC transporter permease [Vagococcus carniphilus]MDT2831817.1 iron ABC transporter permease [Vagococcus carniphilus]MDT2834102.1 iron ABC transporter permease [Vagococcus carniphilus]MDT2840670.1 iron ABC transporter permease [Vagococcus carniphilus]MDT2855327.1 iron ABC transporter permease [Vagococcus carniphilus]
MSKKNYRVFSILCLLLVVSLLISPLLGQIKLSEINWLDTWHALNEGTFSTTELAIILKLRLPRIMAAAMTGSGLALAGLVMQACIQNPLADPYILGVSSGATAGATFAIVILPTLITSHLSVMIAFSAFLGGILTTCLILRLSHWFKNQLIILILIGVVINSVCQALTSLFIYKAPNSEYVKSATYWTMGSLVGIGNQGLGLMAGTLLILTIYFFKQSHVLDLLLLGNEQAESLGIESQIYQRKLMLASAVLTSVLVSQTGVIGFIGLIVPHLARKLVGNKHQLVIITSLLLGSILLIWADCLARIVVKNSELPIGVVTSLIGAPLFFMIILDKYKNQGGVSC